MRQRLTPAIDPDAIGELVRDAMGEGPTSAARLAQRERLVQHATTGTGGRGGVRWAFAALGMVAAAVLVAVVLRPWGTEPRQPAAATASPSASEWLAAPAGGVVAVDIGDGTHMQLVDGARGRMTRETPDGAIVVLETGRLEAEVEPSAGRRWTIEAGPYRVRVVGTIFSVVWEPGEGRLDVEVQRGKVEVSGPTGASPIPVDAGRRLRASLPDATAVLGEIARADPEPETPDEELLVITEPSEDDDEAHSSAGGRKPRGPAEATASWQALAREGEYARAFALADAAGFSDLVRGADRASLELLADTARLAKRPSQATTAYTELRERFAKSAAGARAAFQLGRLAADRGGDAKAAARWFRTSLTEDPAGSFAPQARGRLVQALLAAGDREAATVAARDYLERHPRGAYAKLARSLAPP